MVDQVVSYYGESTDEEIGGDDFDNYLKENIPTYMLEEILKRLKKEDLVVYLYIPKRFIFFTLGIKMKDPISKHWKDCIIYVFPI